MGTAGEIERRLLGRSGRKSGAVSLALSRAWMRWTKASSPAQASRDERRPLLRRLDVQRRSKISFSRLGSALLWDHHHDGCTGFRQLFLVVGSTKLKILFKAH